LAGFVKTSVTTKDFHLPALAITQNNLGVTLFWPIRHRRGSNQNTIKLMV